MTIIAAFVDDADTVWMASDSRWSDGKDEYGVMANPKLSVEGRRYLVGIAGEPGVLDAVRYRMELPVLDDGRVNHHFMATVFHDAMWAAIKESQIEFDSGAVIVGVDGQLFEFFSNHQVFRVETRFSTIGSGETYARGALAALEPYALPAKDIVQAAVKTAIRFNSGCGGRVHTRSVKPFAA